MDGSEDLAFTGERFMPSLDGSIALEHWHRYLLARELVAGKTVLDIACGEGYGSALLAETAAKVTGVDISDEAVRHAAKAYTRPNLHFLPGSCAAIPLDDGSVDAVVSFETIEHHDQHAGMMAEVRRVLRPGGLLIISSPDRLEYSVLPNNSNEYHVKELFRHEFESLLSAHFRHWAMLGQRVLFGSGLFLEGGASPVATYAGPDESDDRRTRADGMARPLYLVAVATDGELPVISSSFLEQPLMQSDFCRFWQKTLTDLAVAKDEQIEALHGRCADRDRTIADLGRRIETLEANVRGLEGQVQVLKGEIEGRDGIILHLRKQIEGIYLSTSWRVTGPLRVLSRRLSALRARLGGS